MNKLMVMGAAYTQIPLFKAARGLGVKTIAASIKGDYDGFAYADEIAYVDITDPEACVAAAQEHEATAIATCGLDLAMKTIGVVAERLGFPGPSEASARNVSNKYLMKEAFTAGGVTTPPYFCVHNEAEMEEAIAGLTFPVITKAVDQMGSRGIYKCDTPEEVRENFPKSMSFTKLDYCLIEEFIVGTLFCVEGMVQDGRMVFCMPNNSDVIKGATNIPVGHSVPCKLLPEIGDKIEDICMKAVQAVGLNNCPVDFDCILRDGEVYIIEMTGRSGAAGLSEIVSNYYGINYYETIVKLACGMDVSYDFVKKPENISVLANTLRSDRGGILNRIRNYNLPDSRIKELSFNVVPGDEIRAFTNGRDRTGQVILKTGSLEESYALFDQIENNIVYEMEEDITLPETVIHKLRGAYTDNTIYVKRDDLLPLSFGGNKVRFADAYLRDMEKKGCNAMIIYGGYTSNLCRILSEACIARGIPCSMIYNTGDSDPTHISMNARFIRSCEVKEYICSKSNIAETVDQAMQDFVDAGYKPYYMHGNRFGQGNATTPMDAYVKVYNEICMQEMQMNQHFDYIFIGSGTNTSQAGLIAGHLIRRDERKIVGLSTTRFNERAMEVLRQDLKEYAERFGCTYPENYEDEILFSDKWICGGYGQSSEQIKELISEVYKKEGFALDPIYTGKSFNGMLEYLKENAISGKKILFVHSGGAPLFFDYLSERESI